jgi:hypothetical protein
MPSRLFAGTHAIPDELDEDEELDDVIPDEEELDDEFDDDEELDDEELDDDVDGSVSPHPTARAKEAPTTVSNAACCLDRQRK